MKFPARDNLIGKGMFYHQTFPLGKDKYQDDGQAQRAIKVFLYLNSSGIDVLNFLLIVPVRCQRQLNRHSSTVPLQLVGI